MSSQAFLQVLSNPQVGRIYALEQRFLEAAAKCGAELRAAPNTTYLHLSQQPFQKLSMVQRQLHEVVDVFETCASQGIDPWDDAEFFNLSMRRMGLNAPSDFLQYVAEGDLVEGYDMDRVQVFRNMTFMQQSGYSLMEMLSYEWPALFDRAGAITQQMISYCDVILWEANKTIPFDVPPHFLRERQSNDRLSFEIRFRYLSPLFSGPDRPFGILGTCKAIPIIGAEDIEKLSFV